MRLAADRDLSLLHRLEQRALHLRGRAVDLVREHEVRDHRPDRDLELSELLVEDPRPDDVGGNQIRRELDALELAADRLGERLHGQGLGEPGDALDEEVAAREERDDHPLEQGVLADDHALDLVEHLLQRRVQCGLSIAHGSSCHLDGAFAAPPAVPIGTAKPMPMKKPLRDGLARAVTIPITCPPRLSSGPPELPGLTAASNWIRPCNVLPSFASVERSRPEMTPDVSEST